ncbi:hypothetical protein NMY22_g6700 [Coprinellus aureogranulatus]|nr:hypothetical protein NMY22_g6700 [Coprinellus aureogranulatus]
MNGSSTSLAGPLLIGALFSYFLYGAFVVQSVAFVSLVELASVIGVTGNVYHILCKLILHGDFTFQAPPMAMLLAVYLSLDRFSGSRGSGILFSEDIQTVGTTIGNHHQCIHIPGEPILAQLDGSQELNDVRQMGLIQLATSTLITYVAFAAQRELARLTYDTLQQKAITLWLASAAASDLTITATLVYLYMGFRERTERRESKSVIKMLILHTVENGAITSLCALLQLVFYSAKPDSLIFIAFSYINSRLYANVLLASLNANRTFQRQVVSGTDYTLPGLPQARQRQGLPFPPATTGASRRRHSLSAPYQRPVGSFIATRTETVQFTTIDTGTLPEQNAEATSAVGPKVEGYWKHGTIH